MIYILEGADGTGKTTLAKHIANVTTGHILHSSYNKEWDIENYHVDIIRSAIRLNEYQDVVIDRWAPSEWVYGHVFRDGPQYNVFELIKDYNDPPNTRWIICKNENAVVNHLANSKRRDEMFEDMTDVVANFSLFASDTPELNWIEYNYNHISLKEFTNEHVDRR